MRLRRVKIFENSKNSFSQRADQSEAKVGIKYKYFPTYVNPGLCDTVKRAHIFLSGIRSLLDSTELKPVKIDRQKNYPINLVVPFIGLLMLFQLVEKHIVP